MTIRAIKAHLRREVAKREAEIATAESQMTLRLLGAERRGLVLALDIVMAEHATRSRMAQDGRARAGGYSGVDRRADDGGAS
jgi:hypothetical protein